MAQIPCVEEVGIATLAFVNHRVDRCIKQLLECVCFSTKWLNLVKQLCFSSRETQILQSNKLSKVSLLNSRGYS